MDNSDKSAGAVPPLGSPKGWCRPDVLAASLTINLFSLALPIVVLQVYDRIIPNQAHGSFFVMLVALGVVVVFDAALRILRSVILSWSGARFEHRQSMRMVNRILSADTLAYESSSPGSYLDRFQNLEKVQEFYTGQSILLLVDLPFVPLFLFLIWLIAGNMVFIPVVLLLLFLAVSVNTGTRVRKALKDRVTMDERRQNFVIETLRGMHTIKSMAMRS